MEHERQPISIENTIEHKHNLPDSQPSPFQVPAINECLFWFFWSTHAAFDTLFSSKKNLNNGTYTYTYTNNGEFK